ncbi:histidine-rich glycoprotein-like [Anopheles ziemanni]|uniref:histidine-rich glycoprotein-like n=1 Tax=Anopheles coustani TaxID=139045 RepID=UPI00265A41D3|nr:histidine-rich glycoprotein-like [Anopheles coustani]XP_058166880.1 histidine-rich glycoprotein-like [Anopheles ziemanni]
MARLMMLVLCSLVFAVALSDAYRKQQPSVPVAHHHEAPVKYSHPEPSHVHHKVQPKEHHTAGYHHRPLAETHHKVPEKHVHPVPSHQPAKGKHY